MILGGINILAGVIVLFLGIGSDTSSIGGSDITTQSLVFAIILIVSGIFIYFIINGFASLIENSFKQVELSKEINAKLEVIMINNLHDDKKE